MEQMKRDGRQDVGEVGIKKNRFAYAGETVLE